MSDTVRAVLNAKGTHIHIDLLFILRFERNLSICKTNIEKNDRFNSSSMLGLCYDWLLIYYSLSLSLLYLSIILYR